MLHCNLQAIPSSPVQVPRTRVCAVSFLNTTPLVWGLLHGPQRGIFDLSFSVPAVCADRLRSGEVDVGLVPCAELNRQQLEYAPETGIACHGPVRSILLVAKVPIRSVHSLAVDANSRSSAMLARIILERKYGVRPHVVTHTPDLRAMLDIADAALVIGDPALALDPLALPYEVLDLGSEWLDLTGLSMVFAVWAGRTGVMSRATRQTLLSSWLYGKDQIEDIVRTAAPLHGVSADLAFRYLTRHIRFELGELEHRGLELYLKWSAKMDAEGVAGSPELVQPSR